MYEACLTFFKHFLFTLDFVQCFKKGKENVKPKFHTYLIDTVPQTDGTTFALSSNSILLLSSMVNPLNGLADAAPPDNIKFQKPKLSRIVKYIRAKTNFAMVLDK